MFESQLQTNLCCAWPSVPSSHTFTGVAWACLCSGLLWKHSSTNFEYAVWARRIYSISIWALSMVSVAPNRKRTEALRESVSGAFRRKLSFSLFPLFVALPHSFHTSGCQSRMQSLRLFLAEAPVASLPQTFFSSFLIPQSSTAALVYSNQGSGRRQPEGIFTLEYEICCPLGVVESQSQLWFLRNTKQKQQQSARPLAQKEREKKGFTRHCWSVAARTH